MLRQRLNERFANNPYDTPKTRYNLQEDEPVLSEKKIAIVGLIFSLLVIVAKVITNFGPDIEKALLERKLVTLKILTEDGNEMFTYTWKTAVKYSNIWVPAFCGIMSTYFTWIMVYLDSHIPGVQPPSPFSPKKYRMESGHTFHLNYVFALLVGILVFFYMYFRGVSIQY